VSKFEYSDSNSFDEDYDEFNLHMTPNSVTSQDCEQLDEHEMIHPKELCLHDSFYHHAAADDDEHACDSNQDYVEFEEDWEILHAYRTERDIKIDEVREDAEDADDF
jgi:acetyltransferase-like isoleucine patch superfamily enzyme